MTDLSRHETRYLVFTEVIDDTRRTRMWCVLSRSNNALLGRIKWYGPWRQFTFHPEPATVFNIGCLLDINEFMAAAYRDWRDRKNKPVDSSTSG